MSWALAPLEPDPEPSRRPLVLLYALAAADLIGIGGCAGLVLASYVRHRPVDGLALLLVPAVPVLITGQLWAIVYLRRRRSPGSKLWELLGGLGKGVAVALIVLAAGGWLAAFTTGAAGLSNGGTDGGSAGCPYRLRQHTEVSCVSRAEYLRAGAAEQRFAGGVLLGFFSMHAAAALAGAVRHRKPDH